MGSPSGGYFGKFVDVDLTEETVEEYPIPAKWTQKYLGGRGIGARLLLEELPPDADPLGEQNVLVFATGPLQGTGVAGAGRYVAMAKSPKTGSVSGSYAGGFFPHELGGSGYDGIIVRGAAATPKYLALTDGSAEIRDADDLWGAEVATVDSTLTERHDGGRVACIGVAGENRTQLACIINDRNRAAGRPGFGAVMGSKRLKAVIARGDVEKPVHDPDRLRDAKTAFVGSLRESGQVDFGEYGTPGALGGLNDMGVLPTRNFREGVFEGADAISGEAMNEQILTGRDHCTGCPVMCKRVVRTEFLGDEVTEEYGGPEYESLASLGSLLMSDDLDSIALANQKCNAYGLDTISVGNAIAFLMEASERGYLNRVVDSEGGVSRLPIPGYELERLVDGGIDWGDEETIIDLIDQFAHAEGVGAALVDGLDAFAEEIGAEFAVTSKGQEFPMHEARGKKGLGISYATSPRGATHLEGFHDETASASPELGVSDVSDRFSFDGKPTVVPVFENLQSFINSAVICSFVVLDSGDHYNADLAREMVNAVTGFELDAAEMLRIGERNFNLLKVLAAREGYSRADDGLPARLTEPLPDGPSSDEPIPDEEIQAAIDQYYAVRGWDDDGPTTDKLAELDMEAVAR